MEKSIRFPHRVWTPFLFFFSARCRLFTCLGPHLRCQSQQLGAMLALLPLPSLLQLSHFAPLVCFWQPRGHSQTVFLCCSHLTRNLDSICRYISPLLCGNLLKSRIRMWASPEEPFFSQVITRTILQPKRTFLFLLTSLHSLGSSSALELSVPSLLLKVFLESDLSLFWEQWLLRWSPESPALFLPRVDGGGCLGPWGQALCVYSLPCLYLGSFMVLIAKREVWWFCRSPGRNLKPCARRRTASDPRKICNLCSRRKSG